MKKSGFIYKDDGKLNYPRIILATVSALKDLGGSGKIEEIDDQVIENEKISDEEQAEIMVRKRRNMPKLNYCLFWARTYLKKGNAVENSKNGVWTLNPRGYEIETLKQAEDLLSKARKEFAKKPRVEKAQQKTGSDDAVETLPDDGEELPDKAISLDEESKNTILGILRGMDGYAFERFCLHLLRESGFSKVSGNEKKGADGGIDGTGILRVNLVSLKISFQCKCWRDNPISRPEIQKFRGALDPSVDRGIFITTSRFTDDAKKEATEEKGQSVIDLIDGDKLYELIKENELGVETEVVKLIRNIDEEFFDRFKR